MTNMGLILYAFLKYNFSNNSFLLDFIKVSVYDRLQIQTTAKRDRSFIDCLRSTALKQPIPHSLTFLLFSLFP